MVLSHADEIAAAPARIKHRNGWLVSSLGVTRKCRLLPQRKWSLALVLPLAWFCYSVSQNDSVPAKPILLPTSIAYQLVKTPRALETDFSCPSGYGVVIPCYSGHLEELKSFVSTVVQYVSDPWAVDWTFVSSDDEETALFVKAIDDVLKNSPKGFVFNYRAVSLGSILESLGIHGRHTKLFGYVSPITGKKRDSVPKESYQASKKVYGSLYSKCSYTLHMDVDSRVVKSMSVKEMFEDFFSAPFYFLTHGFVPGDRWSEAFLVRNKESLAVINRTLDATPKNSWMFGYQAWFFERRTLLDFVAEVERIWGHPIYDVIRTYQAVWEQVSYTWYLFFNRLKYPHYRFESVEDNVAAFLGDRHRKQFLELHRKSPMHWTIMEYWLAFLNEDNFEGLKNMALYFKMRFYKIGDEKVPGFGDDTRRLIVKMIREVPSLSIQACRADRELPEDP